MNRRNVITLMDPCALIRTTLTGVALCCVLHLVLKIITAQRKPLRPERRPHFIHDRRFHSKVSDTIPALNTNMKQFVQFAFTAVLSIRLWCVVIAHQISPPCSRQASRLRCPAVGLHRSPVRSHRANPPHLPPPHQARNHRPCLQASLHVNQPCSLQASRCNRPVCRRHSPPASPLSSLLANPPLLRPAAPRTSRSLLPCGVTGFATDCSRYADRRATTAPATKT